MENLNNNLEALETLTEATDAIDALSDVSEVTGEAGKLSGLQVCKGGAKVVIAGAAAYGMYKFGKDIAVPGIKKGLNAIKGKFKKNEKAIEAAEADEGEAGGDEEEVKTTPKSKETKK